MKPLDTTPEVKKIQLDIFRRMGPYGGWRPDSPFRELAGSYYGKGSAAAIRTMMNGRSSWRSSG